MRRPKYPSYPTIVMNLRLDQELREVARKEAIKENRDLNNFIETVLMRAVNFRRPARPKRKEELEEAPAV